MKNQCFVFCVAATMSRRRNSKPEGTYS